MAFAARAYIWQRSWQQICDLYAASPHTHTHTQKLNCMQDFVVIFFMTITLLLCRLRTFSRFIDGLAESTQKNNKKTTKTIIKISQNEYAKKV